MDAPTESRSKKSSGRRLSISNRSTGDTPLAVFEREFLIGAKLSIAPTVSAGDLHRAGKLRYQACDVNLCYPPATADVEWIVHVVPASAAALPDPALSRSCSRESRSGREKSRSSSRERNRAGADSGTVCA